MNQLALYTKTSQWKWCLEWSAQRCLKCKMWQISHACSAFRTPSADGPEKRARKRIRECTIYKDAGKNRRGIFEQGKIQFRAKLLRSRYVAYGCVREEQLLFGKTSYQKVERGGNGDKREHERPHWYLILLPLVELVAAPGECQDSAQHLRRHSRIFQEACRRAFVHGLFRIFHHGRI